MDKYYIISGSEDGGCSCNEVTKAEVLKRITPNKDGETYYGHKEIHYKLPDELDNFVGIVIIKGKIVVPKIKKVVQEYELE